MLGLLRQDLSNEQIADRLGISPNTVKYHLSEIYSKLGVGDRAEAARWQPEATARRRFAGLFSLPGVLGQGATGLARAGGVLLIGGATVGLALLFFGVLLSNGREGEGDGLQDIDASLGKIAYVLNGNIWVKQLPDGTPEQLTFEGQDDSPRWSPSGEWLSFRRSQPPAGTTTYVMRSDGTQERPLAGMALWAPTEDRLAYISTANQPGGGQRPLWVEDADGSGGRELVPPGELRTGFVVNPFVGLTWSWDGQWLTYSELRRDVSTPTLQTGSGDVWSVIHRVPADGGDVEEIFSSEAGVQAISGAWMGDGAPHLIHTYTDADNSHSTRLLTVNAPGDPPIETGMHLFNLRELTIFPAPDGLSFALVEGTGLGWESKRIVLYEPHEDDPITPLTDPALAAVSPAWSPDGAQIAFAAAPVAPQGLEHADAGDYLAHRRLYVVDRDGDNQQQLTDDPRYRDEAPQWSADGRYILFARTDLESEVPTSALWLLEVATGGLLELEPGLALWDGYGFSWLHFQQLDWWQAASASPAP